MKRLATLAALAALAVAPAAAHADAAAPPPWTKDLVIYEVNPRGYTSPDGAGDGSGSGTFDSLRERLPHIQRTGANAIWLAGFQLANDHFYGIWSNYATIDPSKVDPVLGTEQDLKELVDAAHDRGIRVLLDVVAHGVVPGSPLIAEHPEWFLPPYMASWGMVDYDYRNAEFREWWISTWTRYVTEFGIDGFRVDVTLDGQLQTNWMYEYGVQVWDEVVKRAKRAKRDIAVFGETERYHFSQHTTQCSIYHVPNDGFPYHEETHRCTRDVPAEFRSTPERFTSIQLSAHDEGYLNAKGVSHFYRANGSRYKFAYAMAFAPRIPVFFGGEEFDARQVQLPNVEMGLLGGGPEGAWLYANQLQWSDLEDPARAAMHADVSRILAIKREHRDLLHADRARTSLLAVPATGDGPVPYVRFDEGRKAIVVVGNDTRAPVTRTLDLPLGDLGLAGKGAFQVTDLATGEKRKHTEAELRALPVAVGADFTPGGGYRALLVEPAA
jgi:glycosidase